MTAEHKKETVLQIVADVTGQPLEALGLGSKMGECPGWDSMGHLSIIQKTSDALGREIPFDQLTELDEVAKLIAFFDE